MAAGRAALLRKLRGNCRVCKKRKKQKIKSPGLWGAEALLQALRGCIPGQRKRQGEG